MELFPSYCLVCDKHIDETSMDSLYCSSACRTLDSAPSVSRIGHDGHKHHIQLGHAQELHNESFRTQPFSYPSLLLPVARDDVSDGLTADPLDLNIGSHDPTDIPELVMSDEEAGSDYSLPNSPLIDLRNHQLRRQNKPLLQPSASLPGSAVPIRV